MIFLLFVYGTFPQKILVVCTHFDKQGKRAVYELYMC